MSINYLPLSLQKKVIALMHIFSSAAHTILNLILSFSPNNVMIQNCKNDSQRQPLSFTKAVQNHLCLPKYQVTLRGGRPITKRVHLQRESNKHCLYKLTIQAKSLRVPS